jgi:hypothetical protein
MRLAYSGAEGCPGDQAFRDAVGAHVRGWDPFAPNAPWHLTAAVSRGPSGYQGSAELRDVTGAVTWTRAYPPTSKCGDLVEDLAVAVALHIDPPQGPPRPIVAASPPVAPSRVEPGPDLGPLPPREPPLIGVRIGATAWGDLATAPRPAFAASVDLGYRISWFSIAAEFRGDPPAGAAMTGGATLSVSRLAGALVPCGYIGERVAFVGCLVGEVGQVQGTVTAMGLLPPGSQAGLSAAAGVRVGVEVQLARHLYARGAVDLMAAVVRPEFRLGPEAASVQPLLWESPGFLGGLGLGLVAAF